MTGWLPVEGTTPKGGSAIPLEVPADDASRPRIVTLAVRGMPTSGTPAELLEQAGIDREYISARRERSSARARRPELCGTCGDYKATAGPVRRSRA